MESTSQECSAHSHLPLKQHLSKPWRSLSVSQVKFLLTLPPLHSFPLQVATSTPPGEWSWASILTPLVSEVAQVFPLRNEPTAVGDSAEPATGVAFTDPRRTASAWREVRNGKSFRFLEPEQTSPCVLAFPPLGCRMPRRASEASLGPFPVLFPCLQGGLSLNTREFLSPAGDSGGGDAVELRAPHSHLEKGWLL